MENKWRAARYGLDGALIDFGRECEVPERELILEYLDFVDDVLDELDSREEVEYVRWILEHGTGADRQLKAHASSGGDMRAVMDLMLEETKAGL
jgi:carboxylate-amine ligase